MSTDTIDSEVTLPGQSELWPDPDAAPAVAPAAEPAAPYGRRKDGQPARKPGRPRKARANAAGPKVPAPPGAARTAPRKPAARKPAVSPYEAAVAGPLQMLATSLAITGAAQKSPVLVADAHAIGKHAPVIAKALAEIADQDPRVAAVLERLAQVGPWGALVGALVPLALQLAANHGASAAITFGGALGVVHPQALLDEALAEQQRFLAQMGTATPEPAGDTGA